MWLQKTALMTVVFIDIAGQGLVLPIIAVLLTDPSVGFLPAHSTAAGQQLAFGVTMGAFYFAWFLGSVYVARLSDSIGRRWGMLLCLGGALLGYVLTIVAVAGGLLWLLVLARAITGFTSGNQPIAQAAMVDLAHDDAQRTRNMGLIGVATSIGMVAGPLIGGVFSSKALIGAAASFTRPFVVAAVIVVAAMALIAFGFRETSTERVPLRIRPQDTVLLLWRVTKRPAVMRIALGFLCFMVTVNAFFIFLDDYLATRFRADSFDASMAMLVFGVALAPSSLFLLPRVAARFSKAACIAGATAVMAASVLLFFATGDELVSYIAVVPFGIAFGVGYPTFLAVFSASAGENEQGWVMGVSIALFTFTAGTISVTGGWATGSVIEAPFVAAIAAGVLLIGVIALLWRTPAMREIAGR